MNNMQEQPHYKITPEQGWAKMKPILDEAMPLNKPSGRSPFMWWTTSAVVLTTLVGIALVNGAGRATDAYPARDVKLEISAPGMTRTGESNTTPSTSETQSFRQANSDPAVLSNPDSQTSKAKASADTKLSSPVGKFKTGQKATRAPSPAGKAPVKQAVTVPMAMAADPAESQPLHLTADDQMEDGILRAIEQSSNGLFMDITGDSDISSPASRNKFVVDPIPSISEFSFAGSGKDAPIIPQGTVQKGKGQPSFIEPNVAISGFSGQHGGLGWTGAAGANMNVSRRISITTSVGYFAFHPNSALFGSLESRDASIGYNPILNYDPSNTGYETYIEAEAINNEAGYNVIIPLVEKLTQWQVSAGLKWKFARRFYTEGGMQCGFAARGFSEYPIASLDGLGTSSPSISYGNSLNDYKVIRSTSMSFYAGFGYRVGQHIDLFANYAHAFEPYLLSSLASTPTDQFAGSRTDYIRGVSLGLRYTL
jgi:hypothetical protein